MVKKRKQFSVVQMVTVMFVFVLVAMGLYIVSQLVARGSVSPNAPESKPSAMFVECANATTSYIGKCGTAGGCANGYKCVYSTSETGQILTGEASCKLDSSCSANCPRLAYRCSVTSRSAIEQCDGNGYGWSVVRKCELGCQSGLCNTCKPGYTTCSTKGLTTCNSNGQGTSLSNTCPSGQIYDCSINKCKLTVTPTPTKYPTATPTPTKYPTAAPTPKEVCTPGAKICNGTRVYTCNSGGSAYVSTTECYPILCRNGACTPR